MKAINPFAILDVDEAATREEIDAAYRHLARMHHPDRHAHGSPEAQQAAAERMTEINYAYGVLTDRAKAAAHKRTIDQIRAAGHHVPNPPRREQPNPPPPPSGGGANYRATASSEFPVASGKAGTHGRLDRNDAAGSAGPEESTLWVLRHGIGYKPGISSRQPTDPGVLEP